jgi:hypothetical protein
MEHEAVEVTNMTDALPELAAGKCVRLYLTDHKQAAIIKAMGGHREEVCHIDDDGRLHVDLTLDLYADRCA